MFSEFFRFELKYWLRGWMIYIFLGIMTLLFGLAASSDNVQIGGAVGNTYRNAPYIVAFWYAIAGSITCFMAAAIFDSAASRDFATKMSDILYSKPLRKWPYLLGRFTAATLVSLLPILGVSVGLLIAHLFNWEDTDRWGPTVPLAHLTAIGMFAIPNTLLFGSIVFAIATVTRNTLYSFMGLLALIVGYSLASVTLGKLELEMIGALSDPFGATAFDIATKYWTVDERNTQGIPWTTWLILNRVLWLSVAFLVFLWAGSRFSFETGAKRGRAVAASSDRRADGLEAVGRGRLVALTELPIRQPQPRWLDQLRSAVASDVGSVVRTTTYLFILAFATINISFGLLLGSQEFYGLYSFPVTYRMVEEVNNALVVFPLAIITYFTGVLVWRDRESRMHEIVGATPTANAVFAVSRFLAMLVVVLPIVLLGIVAGCGYQWLQGYTRFELGVYFEELVVLQGLRLAFLIVVGLVAHSLAPNKYVGYANFLLFTVLNVWLWQWLRWDSLLVRFGGLPSHTYSDLFGLEPFRPGLYAFATYWGFVSIVLLWLTAVLLHRGTPATLWHRLSHGLARSSARSWVVAAVPAGLAIALGSWLYYQTMIVNTWVSQDEVEQRQADYETTYQTLAEVAQPRVENIRYQIDIYPEERNVRLAAVQTIVNKSDGPIETLYLNVAPQFDTDIEIPRAILVEDDQRLLMRTYRLDPPLSPQESLEMKYAVKSRTRGIENQVSQTQFVQNGTFFNNSIAPQFGFDSNRRIMDPNRRKALGLPEAQVFPALVRDCGDQCLVHYISNDSDWVTVETVISTSADQIAVAPGSLVKQWQEGGRNFFQYRLDHRSLNFYSFVSARYEVARSKVGDVDTEVYYHKEHAWNVPKMTEAMQMTLAYCSQHFGPYKHKQARIIEFPRIAGFAQAFPGTMPYSESVGFIANLEKPDDIDMVHYIVAHEMGHQWWAHQVIGAKMQGATLLSETLAQYTALMVMREKYGEGMMHKFLEYEMDRYLRSRGSERMRENPLVSVDPNQGYIHYQKGGIVLYHLAEMIGEERVNAALASVIQQYAYQGPPYPNAYALIDALKAHTPTELHGLIKNHFEEIILYGNRTLEANAQRLPDGRFKVRLQVECAKFAADAKGKEVAVPMDDWVDVGAFARPEPGHRYGKLLHRERVQLTSGQHEIDFVVDQQPDKAGIDPQRLLIDRVPSDNLKTVVWQ